MKRCLFAMVILCASVRPATANRVFSSGFEVGSAGNYVEWQTGPYLPQITKVDVRTGTYAALFAASALQLEFRVQVPPATAYFARCYFWFDSFPAAETTVFQLAPGNVLNKIAYVTIDSGGILHLRDEDGASVSGSQPLVAGQYHRIELHVSTGGAAASDQSVLRVNGYDEAVIATADYNSTIEYWQVGRNINGEQSGTGEWRVDDCGLNDTSGINNNGETTWPGEGRIIHLHPNGEGDPDSSPGVSQVGYSPPGQPTDCTESTRAKCLDDLAFDGSWTYVELERATSIVDVDVDDVVLPENSQVQFVAVGIRFTCESKNPCNHVVGVKSQPNGTVASATTSIVLSSAYIWWTHSDDAGQRRHRLVQYRDPQDVTLRWTNDTIDSMQLRVATTDGNPDTYVTAVWALVEYETQSDLAITIGSR